MDGSGLNPVRMGFCIFILEVTFKSPEGSRLDILQLRHSVQEYLLTQEVKAIGIVPEDRPALSSPGHLMAPPPSTSIRNALAMRDTYPIPTRPANHTVECRDVNPEALKHSGVAHGQSTHMLYAKTRPQETLSVENPARSG